MQPERALLHVVDAWDHDRDAFRQRVVDHVVELHGGALRPVGTWGMLWAPWGTFPRSRSAACSALAGTHVASRTATRAAMSSRLPYLLQLPAEVLDDCPAASPEAATERSTDLRGPLQAGQRGSRVAAGPSSSQAAVSPVATPPAAEQFFVDEGPSDSGSCEEGTSSRAAPRPRTQRGSEREVLGG